jgi:hypothetical protein
MVLCPVALAVGCSKCPVFAVCPAKGLIGDHRPGEKVDKDDTASKKSRAQKR